MTVKEFLHRGPSSIMYGSTEVELYNMEGNLICKGKAGLFLSNEDGKREVIDWGIYEMSSYGSFIRRVGFTVKTK